MTEPIEVFDMEAGFPALVLHISDDRTSLSYELRNGVCGRFGCDEVPQELAIGDVILLRESNFVVGDHSMWEGRERDTPASFAPAQTNPVKNSVIGVVRRVFNEETLIDDGGRFHLIPGAAGDLDLLGHTVAIEGDEARRSISESPILPGRDTSDGIMPKPHDEADDDRRLSYADFGGYGDTVDRVRQLIEGSLKDSRELRVINARPIRGVLFTGDSGTGKTLLARVIANESGAKFFPVNGPEIVSKWVGESEWNLRRVFDEAGRSDTGAIIFFDEIDSIAPRRSDESHEMSKKLVGQLLTLMDGFNSSANVVVIAATNRVDDIDPALRRPGRFDEEVFFPFPSFEDRIDILNVSMRRIALAPHTSMPIVELAVRTEGWSGAELTHLWSGAALLAEGDGRDSLIEEDLVASYERTVKRLTAGRGRR